MSTIKKSNKKTYPALFYQCFDGIDVIFPDLDGCVAFGLDMKDAITNAKYSLIRYLLTENDIMQPSKLSEVKRSGWFLLAVENITVDISNVASIF